MKLPLVDGAAGVDQELHLGSSCIWSMMRVTAAAAGAAVVTPRAVPPLVMLRDCVTADDDASIPELEIDSGIDSGAGKAGSH
jgi:hypothetical protein